MEVLTLWDTFSTALAKSHGRCPARMALECAARVGGIRHRLHWHNDEPQGM